MATAYTSSLRLALPVTGELNGTWGDVINQQITSMVEQAVAGRASIAITGNYTLSTANGTTDEARNMVLQFTGTLSGNANIVVPSQPKVYFVDNATTGGFSLVVKTSTGTGVTLANGKKTVVCCDGSNVVDLINVFVTPTSTDTLTNKTLSGAVLNDGYTEEVFAVSGTTPALSPTNGSIQTWTLSGNSTPTAGTWAAGQSMTLMIDDGAGYSVTWTSLPVTWKTGLGGAPTLNTTGYTVVTLWKVGTVIYGARVGDA